MLSLGCLLSVSRDGNESASLIHENKILVYSSYIEEKVDTMGNISNVQPSFKNKSFVYLP